MVSSVFQDTFLTVINGFEVSKFITMRLQYSKDDINLEPHFECFMVSDQFQAFHKNGFTFEKNIADATSFDLITTKHE